MCKVSVVIATYNMAEWIPQAVETVEHQTLKDIEVIFIDDGSTDNTLDILKSYASNYSNIVIIHQENQGSGSARNRGIEHAKGEYISFLDADDYFYSNDALQKLYNKAKEKNAVICRGSSCDDRNGIICIKGLRPERIIMDEGFISKEEFPGPVGFWAGIYQRSFLNENAIRFPNLLRGQDVVFSVNAISKAGEIYCIPDLVYVYRKEHKAVVFTVEKAVPAVKAFYEILKISSENGMKKTFEAWKKELYGEPASMLYKYAAEGNQEMLSLATKLNQVAGTDLYEGEKIIDYVKQVRSEKEPFLSKLRNLDKLYVFGAGTVGRKVILWLKQSNVPLSSVVVTNTADNPKEIEGIPVKPISVIDISQNYCVIIATFGYLQDSIKAFLHANRIKEIYPIDLNRFHLWQDQIVH